MKKYLFTDGTNVIREVQSEEELQTLIQSSEDPGKIRIWIFNTNEWVTHAEFSKRRVVKVTPLNNTRRLKRSKKTKLLVVNGLLLSPGGWSRLLICIDICSRHISHL